MQPFYPQIPQFCPYIMPQMPFNFGMPGMPNMMNPYQQYPQNGFQNPRA